MKCEKCRKNEATVFYKENINGKVKTLALCEKCSREENLDAAVDSTFSGMFSSPLDEMTSLFSSFLGLGPGSLAERRTKVCPVCGTGFGEIAKTGMLGCPDCYSTFADELSQTIDRIHSSKTHVGTVPARLKKGKERKEKIKELEKELKESISEENYERAAEIRDELREIKKEEEKGESKS